MARWWKCIATRRLGYCKSGIRNYELRITNYELGKTVVSAERTDGETMTIIEQPTSLQWDYDGEADVVYLSVGEPRPAISVDIGEG